MYYSAVMQVHQKFSADGNALYAAQVRVLVNELRKQVDTRVGELADDLAAEPQHASGDPDALIFKVDQKLLPPAVRPAGPLLDARFCLETIPL